MSVGETGFYSDLIPVVDKLKERSGLEAEITKMKGKHVTFQNDYEANNFEIFHYNNVPGISQYNDQLCLGYQSVFQFRKAPNADLENLSIESIVNAFEFGLKKFDPKPSIIQSDDIGDGVLAYSVFGQGHAVLVWDGNERIDISVFTFETKENHAELKNWHKIDVAEPFLTKIDGLSLMLIDEQPRGVNHVINLADDIGIQMEGCYDIYNQCEVFSSEGHCDENDEYYAWMVDNCPLSCAIC